MIEALLVTLRRSHNNSFNNTNNKNRNSENNHFDNEIYSPVMDKINTALQEFTAVLSL